MGFDGIPNLLPIQSVFEYRIIFWRCSRRAATLNHSILWGCVLRARRQDRQGLRATMWYWVTKNQYWSTPTIIETVFDRTAGAARLSKRNRRPMAPFRKRPANQREKCACERGWRTGIGNRPQPCALSLSLCLHPSAVLPKAATAIVPKSGKIRASPPPPILPLLSTSKAIAYY